MLPKRNVTTSAPERVYTIVFDGGSLGNPGRGYGSFAIEGPDGVISHEEHQFGDRITNNQAEYLTLIRALERLRAHLGARAKSAAVTIRGDSSLVVNQVCGRWKVKHPDLQPLHRQAVSLLSDFGRADVLWQNRSATVKVLGH